MTRSPGCDVFHTPDEAPLLRIGVPAELNDEGLRGGQARLHAGWR